LITAALLDVDGTLMDNTPLHVLAWCRAFRRLGKEIDATTILHKIGMGGDQLAPAILGKDATEEIEQAKKLHDEEYSTKGLLPHTEPLPGAADLLRALRERGVSTALASSAKAEEMEFYLGHLGGKEAVDVIVTSEDVAATKPSPDIFATAWERLGKPPQVLVFGDTVYDIESAGASGLPCVGLLSGGIERDVLMKAGAVAIYAGPAGVLAHLDDVLQLGKG